MNSLEPTKHSIDRYNERICPIGLKIKKDNKKFIRVVKEITGDRMFKAMSFLGNGVYHCKDGIIFVLRDFKIVTVYKE